MRAAETADGDLVERARGGDGQAFDDLYLRHREAVARTVYLTVGSEELAQDLAQEAFGVAWADLQKLRDSDRIRSWITGIALNLARRRWRRQQLEPPMLNPSVAEVGMEDRVSVIAALRRLPMTQRAVLVLRFYADLDERGIAEALGIPLGTVKSRMARGRKRLAEDLEVRDA